MLTERSARVATAVKLHRHVGRRRAGRFLAEGPNLVAAALARGLVREVFVTEVAARRHELLLAAHEASVHLVTERAAKALSDTVTPAGLVAVCDLPATRLEDVLAGSPQLIAVTVEIREPGNAGTVIRIADAMGAAAVILAGRAAPAADRVSAVVAAMLGAYARDFQGISAQIAGFHNQFVGALRGGAAAYASAEAANVQQTVVNAVNAPAQALLGHPLIGPETVGSSAAAVSFGFGPLLLAGSDPLLAVPFSYPASLPTPFGPVTMTLNGSFDPLTQQVVFDSGSLTAPAPFVYGLGAVGPALTTMTALQNSGTAFSGAVQSGNLLGAAGALLQAPGNAVTGFLFGQTAISQSIPGPSNLGYESVGISVPVGGLLAPLQPVTVTLTPTSGMPTAIQLSGTQFGGLLPALLNGF